MIMLMTMTTLYGSERMHMHPCDLPNGLRLSLTDAERLVVSRSLAGDLKTGLDHIYGMATHVCVHTSRYTSTKISDGYIIMASHGRA